VRLTTIRTNGGTAAGRVDGDAVTLLAHEDVGALLASGAGWQTAAADATGEQVPLEQVDFAPLVVRPEKIICVGLNYRGHAIEAGLELPSVPVIFAKYHRSLIGADDDVVLPINSEQVDWEVELGLVIGTEVRHADEETALAAIAGYTVVNDVSMRDFQLRTSQFLAGKTFEASTPVGPFLVTPDEIDDPLSLSLSCAIDGKVMQDSNTSELVFTPAQIVSYVSSIITLVPGDLIATGTPGGVGGAMKPPIYLRDGNTMTTTVSGLGEQHNRCVAPQTRGALPVSGAVSA
jgi:acylpyruvate hydrolase